MKTVEELQTKMEDINVTIENLIQEASMYEEKDWLKCQALIAKAKKLDEEYKDLEYITANMSKGETKS